jgi:hypothetical protein
MPVRRIASERHCSCPSHVGRVLTSIPLCLFLYFVTISQIFTRDRGPIAAMIHEARCNPKIEFRSDVCLLRS